MPRESKSVRQRGKKVKMHEADPFLLKWMEKAKPNRCIVCGESMVFCLDIHHTISPKRKVTLCASCHRVFDKGGGIEQLKIRHRKSYPQRAKRAWKKIRKQKAS